MFDERQRFLAAQLNAIEKAIYLASEKAYRDLRYDLKGRPCQDFIIQWINENAKRFREEWSDSLCKNCENVFSCHECLKSKCDSFKRDPNELQKNS